ncbi:ATP-binding protein [Demequina soli]|uniref:ATP-binding protein n=1 Tax=Demequina soli TaxID=1638987 RepID=UPI000783CD56|nr:DUF4143 domain-containing protein [Demequina soli]
MAYQRRIVDTILDEVFPHLAAIALEGAKGVGKTATATQRASTVLAMNNPQQRESVASNLDRITAVAAPVLIDEWQLEPAVWDRVRRAVDDDSTGGHFLLAGSAAVAPGTPIHSGAGRIVRMTMRPLALGERLPGIATVSLGSMLGAEQRDIAGESPVLFDGYVDEILASGFPGVRGLPERARSLQLDSYITSIVDRELPENGITVRRPEALRAWLAAYGAATASTASYGAILDAATAGITAKPARATVDSYRDSLSRLFVLDPVPAWTPRFHPLKRLALAPKHHLVDPALAARLAGVSRAALLDGQGSRIDRGPATWLGALFESLVTQSVRTYAQAVDASVGHLRTWDGGREVDLIVEAPDGRIVAIEVKLAATVGDRDVRHLNWLADQLGDRVADRVVITTGPAAYRRADGVAVVPLALLGP